MQTQIECIPCFVRQASEAIALVVEEPARREPLLRKLLRAIAAAGWQGSPPAIGQQIHRIIRQELGCADPYRALKDRMNRAALDLLPGLRAAMPLQPDPREAAVRVAIAGNLLDAGAKTQIAPGDLPWHMQTIWTRPLRGDTAALFRAAAESGRILYLTDNAGEIVFDRVLLEMLPPGKTTVGVRGAAVINDATPADAAAAGLSEIAPVINNGSDAPGTILEDCSEEFRAAFDRSDLVIAKGQGNYETLSEAAKRIFFLFTVKCPVISAHVGEPAGSMVVKERWPA